MGLRILHLSDLHLVPNSYKKSLKPIWILQLLGTFKDIDAIVITGDVFESFQDAEFPTVKEFNPYRALNDLFQGRKVIFCLGNHEFFYRTIPDTLKEYRDKYDPTMYDVHCLDVIGKYDIGKYRFVGNVLWYDGSTRTVNEQDMDDFANHSWMDFTIKEFNWLSECSKCKIQIVSNAKNDEGKVIILCTHCVPHVSLNCWIENQFSYSKSIKTNYYNAYSGVEDFITGKGFQYALCGHTHRRTNKEIDGCHCYNVGNDYQGKHLHYLIEIE